MQHPASTTMTALAARNKTCCACVDLAAQWKACCRKALGIPADTGVKLVPPTTSSISRIRITNLLPEEEDDAESMENFEEESSIDQDENHRHRHCRQDHWMDTALEIQSALDDMARWFKSRRLAYVSVEMPEDEAFLIQSTVTSFVHIAENEIESLHKDISGYEHQSQLCQHHMGIVQILRARLNNEIAEPFGRLQKQRSRKAVQLWQTPMQCSLYVQPEKDKNIDSMDQLLGLTDGHGDSGGNKQQFLPTRPSYRFHSGFLNSYQPRPTVQAKRPQSLLFQKKRSHVRDQDNSTPASPCSMPSETKRFRLDQRKKDEKTAYMNINNDSKNDDCMVASDQLQQEAALLTASLQNDLDSVQKIETAIAGIATLLLQFLELVSDQQENVHEIADVTNSAKKNISSGQEELENAKERTKQSNHYMAKAIGSMAVLLLFLNWVCP